MVKFIKALNRDPRQDFRLARKIPPQTQSFILKIQAMNYLPFLKQFKKPLNSI